MKLSHKITALTSTILLSVAVVSPANASEHVPAEHVVVSEIVAPVPVTASPTAVVSFERVGLTSVKAPVIEEASVVEVVVTTSSPQPPVAAPAPQVVAETLPTAPTPAPAPAPAPVAASGNGGLAGAALAQLGTAQDCTRMVENALAAIGMPVGDLGPAQFLSVGTIVAGPPQAGDILVYGNSHVAIAIGGGQAVHGGFNGGTTGIGPVDVGQGVPTVVRV